MSASFLVRTFRSCGECWRHQRFDSETREQGAIARDIGIARGQQLLAVKNGVRAGQEAQRLQLIGHRFTAGRQAYECFWHHDAGYRDRAYEIERIHGCCAL